MKTLLSVCLISCVLFLPVLAFADVKLERSVKIEARGLISVFESEETIVTMISGERARIEHYDGVPAQNESEVYIVDLGEEIEWSLQPDNAQLSTLSMDDKREKDLRDIEYIEQVPQSGPDALPITENSCQWTAPQVDIDRTGEKERIGGVRAEQYLITAASTCNITDSSQSCDVTWVLDYWNARKMPGDRELVDFRRDLADELGAQELLGLSPVIPRGLLELFEDGWQEVIYEADGLKGYPVKTIMSLHIGGKNCRTRSNDEITRDTVWTNVKNDSVQATKNQTASQVGNTVAQQTARKVGGSFGGAIASGVMGVLGQNAASKALEKKEEVAEPAAVAVENIPDRVTDQVQIFRISSELLSISDARISEDNFEIPEGWENTTAGKD